MLAKIWEKVREKHLYPALPMPRFDESVEIAGISTINKKILINPNFVRKLSRKMKEEHVIEALLDHEVAHHTFCPWDFSTHLSIFTRVNDVVKQEEKAKIITDCFLDIVANTFCVKEMDTKIPELLRNLNKSRLDRIICSVYQRIWGVDLGVKENGLSKVAEKLSRIPYLNSEEWERSARIFARCLRKEVENYKLIGSHGYERYSLEEIDRGLRKLAIKIRDPKKFAELVKKLNVKFELSNLSSDAYIIFYEELSREYSLPVKERKVMKGGSVYPFSLRAWEIDKPLRDMDFWNSYGKTMPKITKLWQKSEGIGLSSEGKEVPDCLIIVDSSGSMTHPEYGLSFAVLGAFCVANAYLLNKAKIAVYNFGHAHIGDELILKPTRNKIKIYQAIAKYFGGGTTIKLEKLKKLLKRDMDIFMITDMDIYNLEEVIEFFKNLENRTTIVYLKNTSKVRKFKKETRVKDNILLYLVEKKEDIPKIVLGRAREKILELH